MDLIAQISAIIGCLLIFIGWFAFYLAIHEGKHDIAYFVALGLLMPVFIVRHWHDAKIPALIFFSGVFLAVAGYSHGWGEDPNSIENRILNRIENERNK